MIKLNGEVIKSDHFPDGTTLMKHQISHDTYKKGAKIEWLFENNEELITLIYLIIIPLTCRTFENNGTHRIEFILKIEIRLLVIISIELRIT
jgi:hypothetical protein